MSTFIRNRLPQPLELHLGSGTVVIGPYAEAAVDDGAGALPQIQVLEQRGHLSVREQAAEPPAPNPTAAAPPKAKAKAPEKGKPRKS